MSGQFLRTRPEKTDANQAPRGTSRFTPHERHRIFKQMVADELKSGPLPYRRRRKLIRYAGEIDILPFDACLLIAEAQKEAGQLDPVQFEPVDEIGAIVNPERWPLWFKLAIAMIIVTLFDLTLLRFLGK